MKRIIVALIITSLFSFIQTEKYYVTFLKGTVKLQRTGKDVKIGDALTLADKLSFKDGSSKVSCISPGKGRFDIDSRNLKAAPGGEFLAALKSTLVRSSNTYQLSTRSLSDEGYDPVQYFRSDDTGNRIALVTDEELRINGSYPLDSQNFFFIQYALDGQTVTRKVDYSGNSIRFTNALLEKATEKIILGYQRSGGSGPVSRKIAEFIPVMVQKASLKEEIGVLARNLNSSDKKTINTEITAHIYDNYGKMGQKEISDLIGESLK